MDKPKADAAAYAKFLNYNTTDVSKLKGKDLTNFQDEVNSFINQYDWFDIPFEENGKIGVKNVAGEVVIPAIFDGCPTVYNPTFFRPHEMVMIRDGRHQIIKTDGSGEKLFDRDFAYARLDSFGRIIASDDNDKMGIVDLDGETLVPFEMDQIFNSVGYSIILRKSDKYGVFCILGHYYFEPKFDDIEPLDQEDPDLIAYKVRLGEEWGYIGENGEFTLDEDSAFMISTV